MLYWHCLHTRMICVSGIFLSATFKKKGVCLKSVLPFSHPVDQAFIVPTYQQPNHDTLHGWEQWAEFLQPGEHVWRLNWHSAVFTSFSPALISGQLTLASSRKGQQEEGSMDSQPCDDSLSTAVTETIPSPSTSRKSMHDQKGDSVPENKSTGREAGSGLGYGRGSWGYTPIRPFLLHSYFLWGWQQPPVVCL